MFFTNGNIFNLALILLLSVDISLNPGPGQSNLSFKLAFANIQSIKIKASALEFFVDQSMFLHLAKIGLQLRKVMDV